MFRSPLPYGKSCPNYRAVSPCSAPVDRGNKARGGPIRIWLLGSGPEKIRSLFPRRSSPLLSSPLLSSPPALCPSARAAEKPSHPSCAGIRMFLGDRQISGLAPVQRDRGLVMQIHMMKWDSVKIIHTETKGRANVQLFCAHVVFQNQKIHSEIRQNKCSMKKREKNSTYIYFTAYVNYVYLCVLIYFLGFLISWKINIFFAVLNVSFHLLGKYWKKWIELSC